MLPITSNHDLQSSSDEELESLIRQNYERCHPGDTLDDLKRRAAFSKEDRGLLRDWMAIAATYRKDQRFAAEFRRGRRSYSVDAFSAPCAIALLWVDQIL